MTERDEVFAKLESLGEPFIWEDVLDEDRALEEQLWLSLARRFARREALLR